MMPPLQTRPSRTEKKADEFRVAQANIVFTDDDLKTLKNYSKDYDDLPTHEEGIIKLFNSSANTLGPTFISAIRLFNDELSKHARTWPALEDASRSLSDSLESAARGMLITAEAFQAAFESTKAWKQFGLKLKDIEDSEAVHPWSELTAGDHQIKSTLKEFLDLLGGKIKFYLQKVDSVHTLSKSFRKTLEYELLDKLEDVIREADKLAVDAKLADIQAKVTALDVRIKEGESTAQYYNGIVNYSWVMLFLGRAIAQVAVGSNLSSTESSLEAWKNDLKNHETHINSLNSVQRRVSDYLLLMADLRLRLKETEQAAGHLSQVWSKIKADIENSGDELSLIDTETKLVIFGSQFKSTMEPWREVLKRAEQLNNVFAGPQTIA